MPLPSDTRSGRAEIISIFGALCLFLSAIEYLIPKPMPFFRLGLANLPLLLGLRFLSPVDLLLVLLLKVLGQGLVNGTLASYVFLFSFAGSAASLAAMSLVYRLGRNSVSLIGVSLFGAMASSLVQLVLAVTFIFGSAAKLMAPFSLGSGLITGLLVGWFAQVFAERSEWLAAVEARYRDEAAPKGGGEAP